MSEMALHCLDHGFVRLIDHMGSDLSIVRAARVSHDADWRAGADNEGDARLIKYLWRNQHTTPFEAGTLTFEVKAPIFVFRQWHRHRTQSYNEVSARYTELPAEYYIPSLEVVGNQSTSNKQGREELKGIDATMRRASQISRQAEHMRAGFELYQELLGDGWPRELARCHLGFSTYSRMFTTMNLLNLFRFLKLRMHRHAQHEIRVYANAMFEFAKFHFPVASAAFAEELEK